MRNELLKLLDLYEAFWLKKLENPTKEDPKIPSQFRSFVSGNETCFERTLLKGHITGSALILTEDLENVLLTHHKKLNLWLQLGGHSDGNPHPHEVALTEGCEESGLTQLRFFDFTKTFGNVGTPLPFINDLDIHPIPGRGAEPEHFHYDIRYVLTTPEPEKILISDESHALRWFPLKEAYEVANQWSMHRQFDKVTFLKSNSGTL